MDMIETRRLGKRFGSRTAVADISLCVPEGCAFGFLGHNGAGKTTVIRMLVGLIRPSEGTIRIGGLSLGEHREQVLARVGAIIEEPRFHPHLSGRENLQVIAAARGPAARPRIEPALARAGLADRAGDRVSSYSQGMRQRLGIARCLLADPQLVILDEPMNGLDPGGISSLTGSRSVTLITVIGWNTLATSILFLATFLGSVRDLVLMMALGSLSPGQQVGSHAHPGSSIALDNFKLPMPAAVAVLIILAWAVLPAAAGALRTRTLDA